MKLEEFKNLSNLLERVIHKYTQIENRSWDYGNGVVLSRPEVHTIMLIGSEPGISVTAVAKKRGITKGAASQMIYKLVDKGIVDKRISPDSDAQVSLYLTDLGKEESRLHDEYHEQNSEPIYQYLSNLNPDILKALIETMEHFDSALDTRLKELNK